MSQFDYGTIDSSTKTGTVLATDLNSARTAWVTNHIDGSAPSYKATYPGMIWINNNSATAWSVNMYTGVAGGDVGLFTINSTAGSSSLATDELNLSGAAVIGGNLSLTTNSATITLQDSVAGGQIINAQGGFIYVNANSGTVFQTNGTSRLQTDNLRLKPLTTGYGLGSDDDRFGDAFFTGQMNIAPVWDFDPTTGIAPHGDADNFVIADDATKVGMSILGASASSCYMYFGDTDSTTRGRIVYQNAASPAVDSLTFQSGGKIVYNVNGGTTAMTIEADTTINTEWDLNTAGVITADQGASTACGYGFAGDIDTGMWSNATDQISFSCGTHVSFRIHNYKAVFYDEVHVEEQCRYSAQDTITTAWDIADEPSVKQTAGVATVVNISNQALNSNGVYTLTFGGSLYAHTFSCTGGVIKWAGGSTPTWAINKTYIISAYCYDGTNIYLSAIGEDL